MQFSRPQQPPMAINNPTNRGKATTRSNKDKDKENNAALNSSFNGGSGLKQPTAIAKLASGYSATTASSRQKKLSASLNDSVSLRELAAQSEAANSASSPVLSDSSAATLVAIPATPLAKRSRLTMGDYSQHPSNERDAKLDAYISEHIAHFQSDSLECTVSALYDSQFEAEVSLALKAPKVTKVAPSLQQKREEEDKKKKAVKAAMEGFKAKKSRTLELCAKSDAARASELRMQLTKIFDLTQKCYSAQKSITTLQSQLKTLSDEKSAMIADLQVAASDKERFAILNHQHEHEKEQLSQRIAELNAACEEFERQVENLNNDKDDMKETLMTQESSLIAINNKFATLNKEHDDIKWKLDAAEIELAQLRDEIANLEDTRMGLLKSLERQRGELMKGKEQAERQEFTLATLQAQLISANNDIDSAKSLITRLESDIRTMETKLNENAKQFEYEMSLQKTRHCEEIKQLNHSMKCLSDELLHSKSSHQYSENANSQLQSDLQSLRQQLLAQRETLSQSERAHSDALQNYEYTSMELKSKIELIEKMKESRTREIKLTEQAKVEMLADQQEKQLLIDELRVSEKNQEKEIARISGENFALIQQVQSLTASLTAAHSEIESLKKAAVDNCDAWKSQETVLRGQIGTLTEDLSTRVIALTKERDTVKVSSDRWLAAYKDKETELENFKRYAGVSDTDQLQNLVALSVEAEALRAQLADKGEMAVRLADTHKKLTEMTSKFYDGEKRRRELHNQIQELRGNVRVMVRVRPPVSSDSAACVECTEDKRVVLRSVSGSDLNQNYNFSFDHVFDQQTKQVHVFDEVNSLVQSALDGYHVCLFSYGQTSSGKTHTMTGSPSGDNAGIIPRSVNQILTTARQLQSEGWQWTLEASFLEIYNESIRDLLNSKHSDDSTSSLDIKRDADGRTLIPGSVRMTIREECEIVEILKLANRNRSVAATKMNERSSRSHSVFTLFLTGSNSVSKTTLSGSLNLCDLAGSERLSKSQAEGVRLKETQAINKSLSALADVFTALSAGSKHVPFRNSKLTYFLQPCLSGDGKTLMIVNVSGEASNANETLCSLRFAAQVNQCEIGKPKKSTKTVVEQCDDGDSASGEGEHTRSNSGSSTNGVICTAIPKRIIAKPTAISRR